MCGTEIGFISSVSIVSLCPAFSAPSFHCLLEFRQDKHALRQSLLMPGRQAACRVQGVNQVQVQRAVIPGSAGSQGTVMAKLIDSAQGCFEEVRCAVPTFLLVNAQVTYSELQNTQAPQPLGESLGPQKGLRMKLSCHPTQVHHPLPQGSQAKWILQSLGSIRGLYTMPALNSSTPSFSTLSPHGGLDSSIELFIVLTQNTSERKGC